MVDRIAKFEIKGEIGKGAYGRVYRAFDPTMRRDVAIKVLTSGGDPDLIRSFRNEAGTTGKLRHENILTVYDFGEHEGNPYLVMELLEGEDLGDVILHGRQLSTLEKIRIMTKVARGLHYAHENGVVHRDVKPANIMLLPDGRVKIMDFGIARLTREADATRSTGGDVLGTVLYMSPEQFREGAVVDKLVDIFAFGAVYYELLTGVHPFDAADTGTMINRITLDEPVPLRKLDPNVPEELERAVLRALAKEREMRYQSLEDLRFDTDFVARELGQQRAAALIDEAQFLMSRGDLEEANGSVREILELDPMNEMAIQLRKQIDEALRDRRVQSKTGELLQEGRALLQQRHFGEAAEKFDSALRYRGNDREIQALLVEARTGQENFRRASRLLAEARGAAQQHDFEAALRAASAAYEADPANPDAEQVKQTIERLREADRLAARERAIESALQEAREEGHAGRWEACARVLEDAIARFSGERRLEEAVVEARDKVAAERRAKLIEATNSEVRTLMSARDYAGAKERLQAALNVLPADTQLLRLSERLSAAQLEFERAQAVHEALRTARILDAERRYEEALRILEQVEGHVGPDDSVWNLRIQISADRERDGEQSLQKALAEVRALLAVNLPERGLSKLQSIAQRFGKNSDFQSAFKTVQAALDDKEEQQYVNQVIDKITRLENNCQWKTAGAQLESALNVYPANPRLARAQEALLAKIAATERGKRAGS